MNYRIQELDSFAVVGQEVELSNKQSKNLQLSMNFWPRFNANLKRAQLSQSSNWVKYAFMQRRDDKVFYYCAIPKRDHIPEGFISKEIQFSRYLVVEHVGSMKNIYSTYEQVYKELLPAHNYLPKQTDFLHFERYDHRFHWNKPTSIIEIWIPIQ